MSPSHSSKETFDIDGYVVTKALDGLFHMVGEERAQDSNESTGTGN